MPNRNHRRATLEAALERAAAQCRAALDSMVTLRAQLRVLRIRRAGIDEQITAKRQLLSDAIADRNACTAEQRSIRAELRRIGRAP